MGLGEEITLSALEEDPYPIYGRLRDEEPVSWVPAVGLWLVTRYADVQRVDLTPELFTAHTRPSTLNRTMGVNMLGSEGPAQQRVRRALVPLLRPREVEARAGGLIARLADELIDGFAGRGEAELVSELAEPIATRSLQHMLGLNALAWQDLSRWNAGIMVGLANFEGDPDKQAVADEASAQLGEAVEEVLDRKARDPDGSVLSQLQRAAGEGMSRSEIVANTKLMLSGGLQEPRDLIALVIWALLSHVGALADVRADARLLKAAIEETLRCYAPVGTSTRQTTTATELAGVALPEGALVGAVLASANRDPRRFVEPETFDLHRDDRSHLAFAAGNHFCPGAWLGRHQARVTVGSLLDRLPALRLDPDNPVVIRGWEFRAPLALHVRWDRAHGPATAAARPLARAPTA